ncbi:hypothetical protein [Porphyrobacter sp. GA68]|uniref:hypothetical protein n=1 Tax=Porphyrobacter sp. GA68 TaxID=2883480 RepID=UPI001D186F02|nr:hypothetical protein [Porphyrobacter sp. GA68]
MNNPSSLSPANLLSRDIGSMLDWWRLAGVDYAYTDTPQPWLAETVAAAAGAEAKTPVVAVATRPLPEAAPSPQAEPIGGARSGWPQDLAQFREWWLTEASLADRGAFPRLAPVGGPGAEIMLLVPMPEDTDRAVLLDGPDGQMAQAVLRAMGATPASAYLATVLPRHMPLPDWPALASRGIGDIVRLHIALAKPRRVVALGRSVKNLFTNDDAVFCGPGLDELRRSARRRERFWNSWLQWTGEAT